MLLILLVVAAGGGVVAYLSYQQQVRRREALALLCVQHGWSFAHAQDHLATQFRGPFPLFRKGDGKRRCRNVVSMPGSAATFFDYSYVERSRDAKGQTSERTVRHAVAVLDLPGWLPQLRLGSEGVLSRLGSAVGFRDIEVESAEFNRRFRVTADDRTHAFDVLQPGVIDLLLGQPLDTWELSGGQLLVARNGRWDLDEYALTIGRMQRLVALVPGYVWRKHGAQR